MSNAMKKLRLINFLKGIKIKNKTEHGAVFIGNILVRQSELIRERRQSGEFSTLDLRSLKKIYQNHVEYIQEVLLPELETEEKI